MSFLMSESDGSQLWILRGYLQCVLSYINSNSRENIDNLANTVQWQMKQAWES